MIQVPAMTYQLADAITQTCVTQLRTSKMYKQPRLNKIKESEDLYNGVFVKSLARENNEPYPFMSGFVDHLYSEIDEMPNIEFSHTDEADQKTASKITAFFGNEKDSTLPHAKWALKDRWSKKLAIFSGRAILKYYASSYPMYKSCLEVVDHYDFHCEPGGGGHLESHIFCGEEGIFKTKEELLEGAKESYYEATQVAKLAIHTNASDYKQNEDDYNNRLNRHRGLGLDPQSNNYTGQALFKLVEWYLTYGGVRYYCLFDEASATWIRVKPLREIFSPIETTGEALFPYVSWATHEDPKVFWSKAPCDDARPIAKTVNKLINQEVYNREKKNKGTRLYDPTMVTDIEALADERPDGLIPIDTKMGKRAISTAVYSVTHGDISGTIDLVQFLDSYHGQKSGNTPGSQGNAEKDKKVGIFFGELKQIEKRLSIHNKSQKEAFAELGLRFIIGLDDHMIGDMPIKMIGASGIEWATLTRKDLKRNRPLDIKVKGGTEESQKNEVLAAKKSQALAGVQTVNPQWRDRQILKNAGYNDDDIKDAFSSTDATNQDLMSEAAQAIEDIQSGKKVDLNRGANAAFMQKIIDYATNLSLKDKAKENRIATALYDYAAAHAPIAAENEQRRADQMIKEAAMKAASTMIGGGEGAAPVDPAGIQSLVGGMMGAPKPPAPPKAPTPLDMVASQPAPTAQPQAPAAPLF